VGLKLAIGRDGRKSKELDQTIKSIIPGHEVQNTGVGNPEPEVSQRNLGAAQAQSWAVKCKLLTSERDREDCDTPDMVQSNRAVARSVEGMHESLERKG
jgi:hypothetical protein